MMKRWGCLLLTCLLLCGAACGEEAGLSPYQSKTKKWTYVTFGRYPAGKNGEEAPILWRVLETDGTKALLLSDKILFAGRIDGEDNPYAGWESSEMYGYLNGEFLNAAFLSSERAALLPQEDGALVSLPDVEDLRNRAYGFVDDHARRAQGTEYARENGLQVYSGSRKDSPYWTRTLSPNHKDAHRRVMDEGVLGYLNVTRDELGARPMVLVSLADASLVSGSGTDDDPYALQYPPSEEDEQVQEAPPALTEEAPAAAPDEAEQTEPAPAEPEMAADEAALSVTEYASIFPALTEEGFLPPGEEEFSFADAENGLWLYASGDLRIEIVRRTDTSKKKEPRRWYEADIFVRDGAEDFLRTYYHELNPRTKKLAETQVIAQENGLVFAVNTDWYYYRVLRNAKKRVMTVGVVLRGGEVFYDDPAKKAANGIPNRDYLALYPDGRMEAYDYNGPDAETLREMGVYDTLCFGPVLVRDGEVTEQALRIGERGNNNPRTGLGMAEKGHYVAIMMEGRTKQSVGCKLTYLADLFLQKGCTVAFNLDGGGTSSMIFMGEYLNENTYSAQNRLQNEVLGIGHSDQVQ